MKQGEQIIFGWCKECEAIVSEGSDEESVKALSTLHNPDHRVIIANACQLLYCPPLIQ